tara:strand:+ start:264 stop:500 length:237 start_codon:yes stop_codon:yes gene_type:complete
LKILAQAEFTEDMAITLYRHFVTYSKSGIVTIEVASNGLWLIHPNNATRQFLGLARFDPEISRHPSADGIVSDLKIAD